MIGIGIPTIQSSPERMGFLSSLQEHNDQGRHLFPLRADGDQGSGDARSKRASWTFSRTSRLLRPHTLRPLWCLKSIQSMRADPLGIAAPKPACRRTTCIANDHLTKRKTREGARRVFLRQPSPKLDSSRVWQRWERLAGLEAEYRAKWHRSNDFTSVASFELAVGDRRRGGIGGVFFHRAFQRFARLFRSDRTAQSF